MIRKEGMGLCCDKALPYVRRWISGGVEVRRPLECRLHGVEVTYAAQATMHCQLFVVNRTYGISAHPLPAHLASTRRISRSSCMMDSAKAI